MVLREDLGVQYAKNMAHFGCGVAMFQPVSACDMQPPCVGYIDGNNRWNFVANVEWLRANGELQGNSSKLEADEGGYQPLERKPVRMEKLGIEWRPRTSMGVRQWTVAENGQTPYDSTISILQKAHALLERFEEWKTKFATDHRSTGIPVGADAHIRYKSNTSFGAVLMYDYSSSCSPHPNKSGASRCIEETLFHLWTLKISQKSNY